MFCSFCGKQISDTAKFCPACGRSTADPLMGQGNANPAPKKNIPWKWIGIGVGACAAVALIIGAIVSLSGSSGGGSSFRKTDTYEIAGLEFEVPSELEWYDIYEHYDWIGFNGDEIGIDAELYEEDDLYNCNVTDIESFIDFADWAYSQNCGDWYDSDIQKFKNGYYSVIEAEDSSCIVAVYMDGDTGWLLCFTVWDSDELDEYLSMGIDIVTSGKIR